MVEELEVKQWGSIKLLDGDVFLGTQKYLQKQELGATKINLRKVWKDFSLALGYNLLAVYLHPEDERCNGVVVFDGALISSRGKVRFERFRQVWAIVAVCLILRDCAFVSRCRRNGTPTERPEHSQKMIENATSN